MTGNLNMMMKFRDMQAAEDIGKKAALGWFDVEFTMYGCVYLLEGRRYYRISPQAEDIYDFQAASMLADIYPSNVLKLTQKLPVPSGMKEEQALLVKKELARTLQAAYPAAFLQKLGRLAQAASVNTAETLLEAEVQQISGHFEERELRRFEALLHYCYSSRKLNRGAYLAFENWLKEERKNMEDDCVAKDLFEKTLYGIAYEDEGVVKQLENANKSSIYEAVCELESKGFLVTPILTQTYWYNYSYCLPDVKADFRALLEQAYDETYLEKLKVLRGGAEPKCSTVFQEIHQQVQEKWGNEAAETLLYYGGHWG